MFNSKNGSRCMRARVWRQWFLFSGMLLLLAAVVCGLTFKSHWRATAAVTENARPDSSASAERLASEVKANYGKLPLSFEANTGQADSQVKFVTRGRGYDLFLTSGEAVLALAGQTPTVSEAKQTSGENATAANTTTTERGAVLRMKLVGANADPHVEGLEELPGKTNYFDGSDPAKWQTDVALYSKVQYKEVYRGIDLIYYGNQGQLEYDFVVAPGASPRAIKLRFEGASRLAVNKAGELTLGIPGGEVTMRRPVIFQQADDGTRRQIEGRYVIKSRNEVGFEIDDFDASKPLVIDPILSYSTYLGANFNENGYGIAVDTDGNAYVTGTTASFTFPVTGATFTTQTGSSGRAFVSKLNPSGSELVYSTYVSGSRGEIGYGIALDASRNAYVVGRTASTDFPTVNAFKSKTNLYKSTDGAQQWRNNSTGLNQDINALAVDPTAPANVYAGTASGVFKSTDGGATWQRAANAGISFPVFISVAVDPNAPATLYAGGANGGFYKSTDRGENWTEITLNSFSPLVRKILFDPANSSTIYLGTGNGLQKSTNGGANWTLRNTGLTNTNIQSLAIDPLAPSTLYAGTFGGGLFKTTDGGANWTPANNGLTGNSFTTYVTAIAVDPTNSAIVYAGTGYSLGSGMIFKSNDGGVSWSAVNSGVPNFQISHLIVSASAPATVYASTTGGGIIKTTNGGASWNAADRGMWSPRVNALVAADASASTLYAGTNLSNDSDSDGFLFKLNPAGNALIYSTYIGGTNNDSAQAVAVDASGHAVVTGNTNSSNFPTVNARQSALSGTADAFVTKFDPAGATAIYSTYLGGSGGDEGTGVAVDLSGNAYVTGTTASNNFPVTPGAFQTTGGTGGGFFGSGDAFVTKLDAAGASLVYSTYLGGANGADGAYGIAVDSSGHAYVVGYTDSATFPIVTRFHAASGGTGLDAFATKLNPAGSGLVYSSRFGGSGEDRARAIALDADANAYVTGSTGSSNFPLLAGALKNRSGLFKSTNGGANWSNDNYGLNSAGLSDIAIDPLNASNVYAATGEGVYKSTDGGRNWSAVNNGLTSRQMSCLAIDPKTPSIIYAGTRFNGSSAGEGIFKTTNGGATWTRINNGFIGTDVDTLTIDPATPTTVYATSGFGIFRSTDGGASWTRINSNKTFTLTLVIDPTNSSIIYSTQGMSNGGVFRSTDGGVNWTGINDGLTSPYSNIIAIDPQTPTTLYVSTGSGVFKSTNSGTTWTPSLSNISTGWVAVDPSNPSNVYVSSPATSGPGSRVLRSTDGGATWKTGANELFYGVGKLVVDPLNPGTIFTAGNFFGIDNDAFVTKINAAGTGLVYSTYLGGGRGPSGDDANDLGYGIAADAEGNAYVTGSTRTQDFPVTPGVLQPVNRGFEEAFIAKLAMAFSISGQVLDAGGAPLGGVKITLSGTRLDSVVTAADGRYSFNNLRQGGSYTVSATRPGFSFAPPRQTFDNLGVDQIANFTATASNVAFYTISGRITETGGAPLAGVQVNLGGSQVEFTHTDPNGAYSFTAPQNGNYTVTPTLLGFAFTPPSQSISNLDANRTADFNAMRRDFVVTNANDHGAGSLRQAILDANAIAGANTIVFDIPQPGVQSIALTSPLPTITDTLVIDATTQPGFTGTPRIELDGSRVGLSASGLRITASNCVVRGLSINRFEGGGIMIQTGGNNRIEGNFIGLDPAGMTARPNRGAGIVLTNSSSNVIGGTSPAARNVISANLSTGIAVSGSANQIKGNYIGTDAAGVIPFGNSIGIDIYNVNSPGSLDNVIGGTEAGARNVISGNNGEGIRSLGAGTIIQGNYIGTDASGNAKVGNALGVYFSGGAGTVIGGTTPAARNVISGNGVGIRTSIAGPTPAVKIQGNYIGTNAEGTAKLGNLTGILAAGNLLIGGTETGARNLISGNVHGIHLESCCNPSTVAGNFIGTDASGNFALGNQYGVLVSASQSIIGGTTPAARNVISGNEFGIQIGGLVAPGPTGNVVQGNYIGTNATGNAPIPNNAGINLTDTSSNTIGGSGAGAANLIAYNGVAGITLSQSASNNAIRRNRIFSNIGLGIDLSPGGVNPNDATDADTGANKLQNFPVVSNVTRNAQSTRIEGMLNSQPNTVYTIEAFSNSACDASGSGEGAQFFHAFEATTDATGAAVLNSNAPLALPAGRVLTLTATDPAGNTSEFSPCQSSEARGSVEFDSLVYNVLEDVVQAKVNVNRVGGSRGAITVNYTTADLTATAGADYTAATGTLTFAEGETSKTLLIPIHEDGATEPEERATLTLTTDDPEMLGGKSAATLNIFDSTTPLTLSVERQRFVEGDTGTKTVPVVVALSAATGRNVTVDFSTANVNATSGSDYQAVSGTLTFAPGTATQNVNVVINGDIFDEVDETFRVALSNPANAALAVNNSVTIVDDDEPPAISIDDVSIIEGNNGFKDAVFQVTLSAPSGKFIRVGYSVAAGTAASGIDYNAGQTFGSVDFIAGETTKTITVQIVGDTTAELDENFFVNLLNPFNSTIRDTQGVGTIRDDDGAPARFIISGRVKDENGNGVGDVTITLSGSQTATTQTVANGQFFLRDLAASGNYVVTPSRPGYVFEPSLLRFDGLSGDVTTADFTVVSSPPVLQFSAANFNSDESAGSATVTVTRMGTSFNNASVDYATTDDPAAVRCDDTTTLPGVAFARCDYATAIDTLTFAPGEQSKTFKVSLIDDVHVEGTERVQLRLFNPVGATLGAQSTATLSINDTDTPGASNPIYTTPFFVRQHYLDFLSREPEAGEPWSGVLNRCPNVFNLDPHSPSALCDQIIVSQSFFGSPEFRLKGFYVFKFYRVAFDRRPTYEEIIPDMRSVTGVTDEEVYRKRALYPVNFMARAEFKGVYDSLDNTAYVNTLLGRYNLQSITCPNPLIPEFGVKIVMTREDLINRLNTQTPPQALTRAQVLRALVESDEVAAVEYNQAFVAMQYYGYLRRTPEEDGFQNWLRVINQDPNNVRLMVNGFMNSTEYRLRFGQP